MALSQTGITAGMDREERERGLVVQEETVPIKTADPVNQNQADLGLVTLGQPTL